MSKDKMALAMAHLRQLQSNDIAAARYCSDLSWCLFRKEEEEKKEEEEEEEEEEAV